MLARKEQVRAERQAMVSAMGLPIGSVRTRQSTPVVCWLPLSVGERTGIVRRSGNAFERVSARRAPRRRASIHSRGPYEAIHRPTIERSQQRRRYLVDLRHGRVRVVVRIFHWRVRVVIHIFH
ncbi:hypothetical protein GCM10010429_29940 [Micromonospora olivasterospora]